MRPHTTGTRDGIDHNGPLTEDYQKEPGDLDFGTRRDFNTANYGRGNGIDNFRTRTNTNNRFTDEDLNISSFSTNRSSKEYPHTRAILVREAKYQYVPTNKDGRKWQQGQEQAAPNKEQQPAQNETQQGTQNQQQVTPNEAREEAQNQQQSTPNQAQQPQQEQQTAPKQETNAGISQIAQQVIDLTNEQRKQNGLSPLQADTQLNGVAQKKSEDMQQNGYFSHTSPTYGSPFDMMRDMGVSYNTAGENIAQGQRTPQEVVKAWMDSPGHRKNILSPDFTHIGVGYTETGHHWTQMFIGK
ncbi:SCP-like extracellular protein [Bacillus sp. B15-48]|nr:SCP-like extracellular protein [Bacillus sp. B15-48]